jgi:hypothetical protein
MIHLKYITSGAFAIGAAFVLPITMQAAVCSVPSGTYPTIQSAASDPSCSEIDVAPGAYSENVVVNFSTTINGAQAGNSVSGRTSGGPAESTVSGANPIGSNPVFMIKASDVTIDGFTIKNTITTGSAVGVDIKNTAGDTVVMNDFIDGIMTADTSGNGTAQGVYLEAGPDNVNVQANEIENVHGNRSTKGVHIGDAGSTDPSQNVQIKGNSIHDITSDTRGGYGVSINNGNGNTSNSGLTILDNTIMNINGGGWVHAIGLEAKTPSVVVNGNTISSLSGPAGNTFAVWFESEEGSSFSTGMVNANNFNLPATQAGIAVDPALSVAFPSMNVDGTCNWWNSPSGPTVASNPGGTGAATTANVTYKPWLLSPAPGGNCFGGNVPTTASQCKNGGWMTSVRSDGSTFKNQGDCIQYVNTGK